MSQSGQVNLSIIARDAASKVFKNVGSAAGSLAKTFATMAAAAVTAMGTAGGAIAKFAESAAKAAIEDQAANEKLVAVLKARGLATKENLALVDEQIAKGAKLGISDDEIRSSIQMATQFTKDFTVATKIASVAQDLAAARGMDLSRATLLVGRAYNGQGGALARFGINLAKTATITTYTTKLDKYGAAVKEAHTKQIRTMTSGQAALNAITGQYGGVAAKMADTVGGRVKTLKNTFSELKESIGYAIGGGKDLPFFKQILDAFGPFVDGISRTIEDNLPTIQWYAMLLKDKVIDALPKIAWWLKVNLPTIIKGMKDAFIKGKQILEWISDTLGPKGAISAGVAALGFKFGGWKGAIAGAFSTAFASIGWNPLEVAVGSAVAAGLTGALVELGIKTMALKIAAAMAGPKVATAIGEAVTTAAAATTATSAATSGVAGIVSAVLPVLALGAGLAGVVLVAKAAYDAIYDPEQQMKNAMDNYAKLQNRIKTGVTDTTGAGGPGYGGNNLGMGTSGYMNLQADTSIKLDGKVIAENTAKWLGFSFRAGSTIRNTAR